MTRRSFFQSVIGAALAPVVAKLLPEPQPLPPRLDSGCVETSNETLSLEAIEDQYAVMRGYISESERIHMRMKQQEAIKLLNDGFSGDALFSARRSW